MSVYDLNDLQMKYDTLANEYQICRCKLDSKCEALLILSKELDQCRSERDQFKLMAEQLRERYQAIKRQISGRSPRGSSHDLLDTHMYKDMETESLVQLLCDTKEIKKSLQFETDDLKQKLSDAQGDIKLLREQIARQRVGTGEEGITIRHFPAYEREDLVKQLEASREQYLQLQHDLQQLLDEKEDQETELDAYKRKYENLNRELNYILKGDEKRIVDIDALVMENKYLNERLKQMEEEKTMAMATASKYKSILERKKNKGILKFGQSRSGGLVITQKQVGQMLHQTNNLPSTPQAMADLQGLCGALLETINDKNLALSHQRKTNKILGNRISELEKKLKTLEVSGLWNIPDMSCLEKLRSECEEVKTLIPQHLSESSDGTAPTSERLDVLNDYDSEISSSVGSCVTSPVHVPQSVRFSTNTVCTDDLDLLPTKETLPDTSGKDDTMTKTSNLSDHRSSKADEEGVEDDGEESETDQLLAGFIIGKTGQKHKSHKDNSRGKYTQIEAKSLLDNQSQSESESSPEKEKYTDIGDYDNDMADKISLLLGDATSKLQNRCKKDEDSFNHCPPGQNSAKTSLTRKSVPKSSLVMSVDCGFESSVGRDKLVGTEGHKTGTAGQKASLGDAENSDKNQPKASFVENLIDMDSPIHKSSLLPTESPSSILTSSGVGVPLSSIQSPLDVSILQTSSPQSPQGDSHCIQVSESPSSVPPTSSGVALPSSTQGSPDASMLPTSAVDLPPSLPLGNCHGLQVLESPSSIPTSSRVALPPSLQSPKDASILTTSSAVGVQSSLKGALDDSSGVHPPKIESPNSNERVNSSGVHATTQSSSSGLSPTLSPLGDSSSIKVSQTESHYSNESPRSLKSHEGSTLNSPESPRNINSTENLRNINYSTENPRTLNSPESQRTPNSPERSIPNPTAQSLPPSVKDSLDSQFSKKSLPESSSEPLPKSDIASSHDEEGQSGTSLSLKSIPDIKIQDEGSETSTLLTTDCGQRSEDSSQSMDLSHSSGSASSQVPETKVASTEDSIGRDGTSNDDEDKDCNGDDDVKYVNEPINDPKDTEISEKVQECPKDTEISEKVNESPKEEPETLKAHPQEIAETSSKEASLFDNLDDNNSAGSSNPPNLC